MRQFFAELKRRNVYKVAVSYAVVGWLLIQVATQVFPFFDVPTWGIRLVVVVIALGLPVALVVAWAFELTPQGVRRTEVADAQPQRSQRHAWIYIAAIAATLSIGLFLIGRYSAQLSGSAAADLQKSIAVLPFANLSRDADNAFFADGLQDELLTRLAKVADLKVISRTSTQRFKSTPSDLPQIAKQLGVMNIVEGTVQKVGDRVRLNVQLINAMSDAHLWAETYDRRLDDMFGVESEVAKAIADALQAKLTGSEKQLISQQRKTNPEAYEAYLRGRFYWNKYTLAGFRKAIEYYNQALDKEPNYALAYAGLADTYIQLGDLSFAPPTENYPQARANAAKALALDDKLPQAHVAMGTCQLFYDWNWTEAEKELKRGIELGPGYADAYHFYNHYLESQGRVDEAIRTIQHAAELDPLSVIINNELGWAYYHKRRYDEALVQLKKALELDPKFFVSTQIIAQIYEAQGRPEAAIPMLQDALQPSDNWSWIVAELGCAHAVAGNADAARQIIDQLKERSPREYVDPYLIATIYAHLNERELAFEWLEKARVDHSTNLVWVKVEPALDNLRADPRFDQLLSRMNLR